MLILAIADAKPQRSIKDILATYKIELICTLGDLSLFDLLELKEITHIPKIGVYGNHCSGNYFEELGIINMHLKTFEYKGIIFGGFEGSVRYKANPFAKMYTQEEAFELLKDLPKVDVFISHSPPYGINDDPNDLAHTGFKALRAYIEEKPPKYFLHGHTYPQESNIITKWDKTQIIYVFREKIIEIS